jgi:hypothetical protein
VGNNAYIRKSHINLLNCSRMDFLAKVMSVCAESFCARRIFIAHRDLLDSVDISDIWR